MLKRIVKMEFDPNEIETFKAVFAEVKNKIRNFEGCTQVELLQDMKDESIFFTYSYWADAEALEAYRNSELFKVTWAKTKKLFRNKAQAWSVFSVASADQ